MTEVMIFPDASGSLETALVAYAFDIAVKGMLVVAVAALVAVSLRGSSAAVRHFVWTVAAAALLALPALSLMLPRWRLALPGIPAQVWMEHRWMARMGPDVVVAEALPPEWPPLSPRPVRPALPPLPPLPAMAPVPPRGGVVVVIPPGSRARAAARDERRATRAARAAATAAVIAVPVPAPHASPAPAPDRERRRRPRVWQDSDMDGASVVAGAAGGARSGSRLLQGLRGRGAFRLLLVVWSMGVAGVLAGIALGTLGVRRMARATSPVQGGWRVGVMRRICHELGLRRTVRLVEGDSHAMPLTWGVLRPVVLVPSSSESWPRARMEAVLRHELAHVRRWDALTQLMAEIACALHWFNPLAWLAARRLRAEREMACDDQVLAAGSAPSEYAQQLMMLARALRPVPAAFAAVAMARPTQLRGRIQALLDERRRRNRVPAWLAAPAWLTAAVLIVPLSAVTPVARDGAGVAALPGVFPAAMHASPAPAMAPARAWHAALPPGPFSIVQGSSCWSSGSAREVSMSRRNEDVRYIWSRRDCEIEVRLNGVVTFTRDFTDIASVEPDGSVQLKEVDGGTRRELEIRRGDGSLTYEWSVNGRSQPFDAGARAWLDGMLLQFLRNSGYAAQERSAYILSAQGVPGLLQEIEHVRGDYARRRYYQAALESGGLSAAQAVALLGQAGRSISSDYELAELLTSTADRYEFAAAMRAAFLAAAGTLQSDYERRRVLDAVLERGQLDAASAAAVVESASAMSSDYEKAQVLTSLARRFALADELRAAYLRAATSISSDYEKRRALSGVLERGQFSSEEVLLLLEVARTISSDHEAATLLMAMGDADLSALAVQQAYLRAAAQLKSDYEHRRVLASLLSRARVAPEALRLALQSASHIDSDFELAELLLQVARTQTLTPELREEFARALDTIESTHEHGRVSSALVRASRNSR